VDSTRVKHSFDIFLLVVDFAAAKAPKGSKRLCRSTRSLQMIQSESVISYTNSIDFNMRLNPVPEPFSAIIEIY
jgi:hypothetical protein